MAENTGIPISLDFKREVQPILKAHCYGCHGPKKQKNDIRFDTLSTDLLKDAPAAETWHDALNAVSIGEMPPDDEPELSTKERTILTDWIRGELKKVIASTKDSGGSPVLRRLNGAEYRYTLTDLLGIKSDYGSKLPLDPLSTEGFRNDGATLGMSALQLESYLESAREALGRVLVEGAQPPRTSDLKTGTDTINGLRPGKPSSRLGRLNYFVSRVKDAPRFGDFTIRIKARAEIIEGKPAPLLHVEYGNKISGAIAFIESVGTEAVLSAEPQIFEFQGRAEAFPLLPPDPNEKPDFQKNTKKAKNEKGSSKFLQFILLTNSYDDGRKPPKKAKGRNGKKTIPEDPSFPKIIIESVEFIGHDYVTWPPEPHTRILFESSKKDLDYASEVFQKFLRRAWRRPPTESEVIKYVDHFQQTVAGGTPHFLALRETLAVALASPNFLFLAEPKAVGDSRRPLNDHELATRLSYFLWSSMPDDELSRIADRGDLQKPKVLRAQFARMLADEKSTRFVAQFSSQWLDLEGVNRIAVNPDFYPNFDESLKADMAHESQHFFAEILRTNTSALQFLDADFTMVNAALAQHYGLEGPKTQHFERVSLKGSDRPGGLLGHAAIHMITSDGGESHPIKRAVWIRERLLNDPPKPPPPNTPSLESIDPKFAKLSIRKQMEVHRSDPACNDCHRSIDPWGIALERYNAIGLWRENILRPSGKGRKLIKLPVESRTVLPGNHPVDGLDGLKAYLLSGRREQFVRALVSKLLTYSLGRSLSLADRLAVDDLTKAFSKNGYRLPGLLEGIVFHEAFLNR
ncbi:MAG: hypothetical protein ACJAQT_000354 [Akkermansiaceae bacterium]|jgi:hypothetical protein